MSSLDVWGLLGCNRRSRYFGSLHRDQQFSLCFPPPAPTCIIMFIFGQHPNATITEGPRLADPVYLEIH